MTDVDHGMSIRAVAATASPPRLVWLFVRSLVVAAVFGSALYAAIYVAQDMRHRSEQAAPATNIEAPVGIELLTHAASVDDLARLTGFRPVLPASLPAGTAPPPRLDATEPAADGSRTAEIRYAAARDADGAAAGPSLVISERRASAGDVASGAAIVSPASVSATVACGQLTVGVRLFFPPSTSDAAALDAGRGFVDALRASCDR
jgi:hypothetical protein